MNKLRKIFILLFGIMASVQGILFISKLFISYSLIKSSYSSLLHVLHFALKL